MYKDILLLGLCWFSVNFFGHAFAANNQQPIILKAVDQILEVNGKKSHVFNIIQPNGVEGYVGKKGDFFNVVLQNETKVPISIHWHGIILPNDQDGVPYVTQLPIAPGHDHHYYFKLLQSGTYWMHSHYEFHEQELMVAPLIINDSEDAYAKDKSIIVMLHDFSFTKPAIILDQLRHQTMGAMSSTKMSTTKRDLNDVKYDAILANRHTLKNPQIITVTPGETIRLRIINSASASNFWVYTGQLSATAIAVDGQNIHPYVNKQFQLAIAQRFDLEVQIPKKEGLYPILAQVEGTNKQAGILLKTPKAKIVAFSEFAKTIAPPLNDQQESQLHPIYPIAKKNVDRVLKYKLTGKMAGYVWMMNNEVWPRIKPLKINKGERVKMIYTNDTDMAHPMHLHGHIFQVAEINGVSIDNGPLRDTILVLPHTSKTIIFDANNPGIWMNHCHVLYHMIAGMMTTTNYSNYREPSYYQALIKGKINTI